MIKNISAVLHSGLSVQFLKYGFTGVFTLVVYLATSFILSHHTSLSFIMSANLAFALALVINYLLNRMWTYDTQRTHSVTMRRYALLVFVGYCLQMTLIYYIPLLTPLSEQAAIILFACAWPLCSFFIMKYSVFETR